MTAPISSRTVSITLEGYVCEAGCIDMGLKRGSPRAIGAVVESIDRSDIEIRGLTKPEAAMLAERLGGKVRISIEVIEEAENV